MLELQRSEPQTPHPAIVLAGQDLTSGETTWTAEPHVGETTFSGGGARWDTDYMHARYYKPIWGRFLSVDPKLNVKRSLTTPQNWNRYSYVNSNPLRSVDPDGRDALDVISYNESRKAWGAAAQAFIDNPSWNTGLTAAARFLDNAYDSAAMMLPIVPGGAGLLNKAMNGAELAQRFAAAEGRADVLQSVVKSDGGLKVSDTVAQQLAGTAAGKDRSFIPTQAILMTIGGGTRSADPQGVAGVFQYVSEATYNGSKGTLTVLVDEKTGTILHTLFTSAK